MEKIRIIDASSFMINAGIDEMNKIKNKIEELEKTKAEKMSDVEIKKSETQTLEKELLEIEENIKNLKASKSNIMEKVEELKKNK
jgi:DNA repair exonuclease SbcCD ATPase subunit